MTENILDLFQDPVQQFSQTQQLIAVDNYFQQLTNYRRLGNKRIKRLEQVIGGYNKIQTLLARFNKHLTKHENA